MVDRGFDEVDLRRMLERASGLREDVLEGRWVVETRRLRRAWELVVEPDFVTRVIVVITAYPVE
ncbi:MAG: hypothetical protein ACRELA_20155 [Candidatus Rokuibacteriota bacterium]